MRDRIEGELTRIIGKDEDLITIIKLRVKPISVKKPLEPILRKTESLTN